MRKLILSCIIIICLLFTACGGQQQSKSEDALVVSEDRYVQKNMNSGGVSYEESPVVEGEKVVYSGRMSIGTEDINKTYESIVSKISVFEGRIESVRQSNKSKSITIRVPKSNFMSLYDSISTIESGTITESDLSIVDYSKSYSDNERRLEILKKEYDEVLELMEMADDIDTILRIKDRLSDITYDIEEYTNINKNIDDKVDYSTLNISLYLIGNNTIEDTPFGRKISDAFKESIEILKELFLIVIRLWWFISIIVVVVLAIKKIRRVKKSKVITEKK